MVWKLFRVKRTTHLPVKIKGVIDDAKNVCYCKDPNSDDDEIHCVICYKKYHRNCYRGEVHNPFICKKCANLSSFFERYLKALKKASKDSIDDIL